MNTKTKRRLIIATVTGIAMALLDALFLEKYFFEINVFRIGKKGSDKEIKLLFLTDLHFKKFLNPSFRKLARKINFINPDLIMISGDLIDEDGIYHPAKDFFAMINYSIPKVGIMGNHDHKNRVRLKTYRQLYATHNGFLLQNESISFTIRGKRLMVTGIDDFIEGQPSFSRAINTVGREENHVLLIHSPMQQDTILTELKEVNLSREEDARLNIQYIFAGHNHGGQVCIFGFAPILPKYAGKYLKGWYNKEPPYLYLSKGFGTSTLPIRFGARSEVTVFKLGV